MNRAIVLVCDSLGVGEPPEAADFGDAPTGARRWCMST